MQGSVVFGLDQGGWPSTISRQAEELARELRSIQATWPGWAGEGFLRAHALIRKMEGQALAQRRQSEDDALRAMRLDGELLRAQREVEQLRERLDLAQAAARSELPSKTGRL